MWHAGPVRQPNAGVNFIWLLNYRMIEKDCRKRMELQGQEHFLLDGSVAGSYVDVPNSYKQAVWMALF
jgi:hypothetical protein